MTIQEIAEQIGQPNAAVRRMITRWVQDDAKSASLSPQQRYIAKGIGDFAPWPTWMEDFWCNNYKDDGSTATDSTEKPRKNRVSTKSKRIAELEAQLEEAHQVKDALNAANEQVTALKEELQGDGTKTRFSAIVQAARATMEKAIDDYTVQKIALLLFQSYIFAIYVDRVFSFLNTQIAKRPDISQQYADVVLHHPSFYLMWIVGFIVDGAGFAIAKKLSEPKFASYQDERMTWIGWFFVVQIAIDVCYLFGTFNQYIEWFGAVIIVISPALSIMAYARATFRKGQ